MSTVVVPYGTVTDTTGDPRFQPLLITAHMRDPIVGLAGNPMHFDGPLSWCAAMHAKATGTELPPIRKEWMVDLALPVATWTAPWAGDCDPRLRAADESSVWGWACSAATYDVDIHTAVQVRRRPAVDAMARFTTDRKHHVGLGPMKARNDTHPAEWVHRITWHVLADPEPLNDLLAHLTHIGRIVGHGHGRITKLTVERGTDRDAWKRRWWPHPDGFAGAIRAPYHHHTRKLPCSSTSPA